MNWWSTQEFYGSEISLENIVMVDSQLCICDNPQRCTMLSVNPSVNYHPSY